jgi:hypothetical protein
VIDITWETPQIDLKMSGLWCSILLYKLTKGVHQMDTLNRLRAEQQARYAIEHEKAMERSPWIRESVNAYRNATPEQLALVEAIVAKRAGK